MSFKIQNLSVLAYANGFTMWHYKAATAEHNSVAEPGHMNEASDMLCAGDLMIVTTQTGPRIMAVVVHEGSVHLAVMS